MDLFELRVRIRDLALRVRGLDWRDPDSRRVILFSGGITLTLILLIVALALVTSNAQQAARSRQAAAINRTEQPTEPTAAVHMAAVRDRLMPAIRADDRFASVLVRPGASADTVGAVVTLQGTVSDRASFDALVDLVEAHGLSGAVDIIVAIGR